MIATVLDNAFPDDQNDHGRHDAGHHIVHHDRIAAVEHCFSLFDWPELERIQNAEQNERQNEKSDLLVDNDTIKRKNRQSRNQLPQDLIDIGLIEVVVNYFSGVAHPLPPFLQHELLRRPDKNDPEHK